jgi:rubrerythrin
MSDSSKTLTIGSAEQLWQPATRRSFLRMLGVGGTVVLLPSVFAACNDDTSTNPGTGGGATLDLRSDTGILNYAYALEQLEAGYYQKAVASTGFSQLSAAEQELLNDVRNHEVIHREFFRAVLGNSKIGDLALNQANVNTATASRNAILTTSRALEDTGVAAYNGAGKYLKDATNLLIAGKIVSVEARHAAAFRDALDATGTKFADSGVVDAQGLDVKDEPAGILATVVSTGLVSTTVTVSNPPAAPAQGSTANRQATF